MNRLSIGLCAALALGLSALAAHAAQKSGTDLAVRAAQCLGWSPSAVEEVRSTLSSKRAAVGMLWVLDHGRTVTFTRQGCVVTEPRYVSGRPLSVAYTPYPPEGRTGIVLLRLPDGPDGAPVFAGQEFSK